MTLTFDSQGVMGLFSMEQTLFIHFSKQKPENIYMAINFDKYKTGKKRR
jgi:hypothetical protein